MKPWPKAGGSSFAQIISIRPSPSKLGQTQTLRRRDCLEAISGVDNAGTAQGVKEIRRESAGAPVSTPPRISKSAPASSSSEFVHGARPSESKTLEASVGEQVRALRKKSGVTVMELSNQSGVSISMLSKIENGGTSPSLATLQSLAQALNVPVAIFFAKFDEKRDASYVKSGNGLLIERRGTKSGHQYRLLGHSVAGDIAVEPYLITLTDEADPYPCSSMRAWSSSIC